MNIMLHKEFQKYISIGHYAYILQSSTISRTHQSAHTQCWQTLTPALVLSWTSWPLAVSISSNGLSQSLCAICKHISMWLEGGHEGRWGQMWVDLGGKASEEEMVAAHWCRKIRKGLEKEFKKSEKQMYQEGKRLRGERWWQREGVTS